MNFTSSSLTTKGVRLITGKTVSHKSLHEMKGVIEKDMNFSFEQPKVKLDALMLPSQILGEIQTIINGESVKVKRIRSSLKDSFPSESGTATGTTILLYGSPGTGKSLTASYIASCLKKPLLKVDCSKILGMYIGESEKNVRQIFDDYSSLCHDFRVKPVLFLNEADQLLGERGKSDRYGEKMYNNMQNLFLEGLENFDGILIATTNMKELLDSAYSRRFTYKIELPAPDPTARRKLWEMHLPEKLKGESIDFEKLSQLPLSGGEIRLVMEQAVRKAAYQGKSRIEFDTLIEIAKKELLAAGKGTAKQVVGFVV